MKAGFGRFDITPRVGVELYGFGPYLNRRSIAVRDILEARAAAFEVNGKKAVIVGCDLCTLRHSIVNRIKELIRAEFPELTDADIMINCSHTHSGPATVPENRGWGSPDPVYMEILPSKIARAAIMALNNLREAKVATAEVPCEGIGLNRVYDKDAPPLEEVLRDDWRPAKPELTDTRCRVIRFDAPDGGMIGFMAYFGCHPVVCCQETRYIHGDYPGVAMHNLMRQFPGSVGVFLQGAQGDVNSCVVHKPEQESMLALDVIAGRFEYAVRQGLEQAKPVEIDTLVTTLKKVDFSTRESFTPEYVKEVIAEKEALLHSSETDEKDKVTRMATVYLQGARSMLATLASESKPVITEWLSGIRLGPIEFLGGPFEIMQGIKNDVVSGIPTGIPLVMSLTNGASGYAPDKNRQNSGSYEATMVPFMQGRLPYTRIHEELVEAFLAIDRELKQ